MPEEPYTGTRTQRGQLRQFTSYTINSLIQATQLLDFPGNAGDPDFRTQVALLKELNWYYVLNNLALATLRCGQRRMIQTLFEIYSNAATEQQWAMFPARFRDDALELARQYGRTLPSKERARLVADVISGMTDQQALHVFQRMTGPMPVLDPIVI